MSPYNEQALINDFPHLYQGRNKGRGFECGDGWESLIRELSAKLEALICALPEEKRSRYQAVQVKQTWGKLVVHMSDCTDEMKAVRNETQMKSDTICEECAQPGTTRGTGSIRTHCDHCWSKFEQE